MVTLRQNFRFSNRSPTHPSSCRNRLISITCPLLVSTDTTRLLTAAEQCSTQCSLVDSLPFPVVSDCAVRMTAEWRNFSPELRVSPCCAEKVLPSVPYKALIQLWTTATIAACPMISPCVQFIELPMDIRVHSAPTIMCRCFTSKFMYPPSPKWNISIDSILVILYTNSLICMLNAHGPKGTT